MKALPDARPRTRTPPPFDGPPVGQAFAPGTCCTSSPSAPRTPVRRSPTWAPRAGPKPSTWAAYVARPPRPRTAAGRTWAASPPGRKRTRCTLSPGQARRGRAAPKLPRRSPVEDAPAPSTWAVRRPAKGKNAHFARFDRKTKPRLGAGQPNPSWPDQYPYRNWSLRRFPPTSNRGPIGRDLGRLAREAYAPWAVRPLRDHQPSTKSRAAAADPETQDTTATPPATTSPAHSLAAKPRGRWTRPLSVPHGRLYSSPPRTRFHFAPAKTPPTFPGPGGRLRRGRVASFEQDPAEPVTVRRPASR